MAKFETLSLRISNCTVIPVTRAIKARRGDYLLIDQEGTPTVVKGQTYRALASLNQTPQKGEAKPIRGDNAIAKDRRDGVLKCLMDSPAGNVGGYGLTTSEIAARLKLQDTVEASNACRGLLQRGLVNLVKIPRRNSHGRIVEARVWSVSEKGLDVYTSPEFGI